MLARILGFVATVSVVVLSGCGGGGGGPLPPRDRVTPVADLYPDCLLSPIIGKGGITGCWLSERCASTNDGLSVRYLAEITEEEFSPITKGSIYDYLLVYDSQNCAGDPVDVVSIADRLLDNEDAVLHVRYALQGDQSTIPYAICSDTMGQFTTIPCISIDMASEYQQGDGPVSTLASRDVFHYGGGPKINGEGSSDEWYLCMSSAYTFDDTGNGGIGVGNMLQDRDTVLDLTDCLTRFEP